jgi:hypothetical protein
LWNGFHRITRLMARVVRYIRNLTYAVFHRKGGKRGPEVLPAYLKGNLLPGELSIARKRLIRLSQERCFPEEIQLLRGHKNRPLFGLPKSSRIRRFTPFLDDQNLLRCQRHRESRHLRI